MESEYFSYVEQDPKLLEALTPALPALRTLSAEEVETLVFYLKSLHSYYPASEGHVANHERFSERLKTIRESPEQNVLQRRASAKLFKAMVAGVGAGVLLAAGALAIVGGALWGAVLVAAAVGLFVLAEVRYGKPALDAAKEQDRRYFLDCIRASRACNELDWSGLFSYNGITQPGPQSDEAIEQTRLRIAALSSQLRNALYNDQYMQYSAQR